MSSLNSKAKNSKTTNTKTHRPVSAAPITPAALFPLAVFVLFSGCGFIDLRPIGYASFPDKAGTILPEINSAVGVRFDTDMNRLETQKAFSVSREGIPVKGDLRWNGRELSFVPLELWRPGLRYTLSLAGTIFAMDGREARSDLYVPFYALSRTEAPYLVSFSPEDGASVGVSPGEGTLRLNFSVPMDRLSVEDALNISGLNERESVWLDENKTLEVVPGKNLSPWTVYRWTLTTAALSGEGTPLAKEAGASFVTGADRVLPDVIEVCPLVRADPATGLYWQRTGGTLEDGPGSGQAIGIVFNKAMADSVLQAIRFEPALAGRSEWWTDKAVVFVPDRDPEPETAYTLIVSKTADRSGLVMENERRFYFSPDIPYLEIMSLAAGGPILTAPENGGLCSAPVAMPDGIIALSVRFSHSFTLEARAAAVLALRLEPYFPGILPQPGLRSARWWSDDTLVLDWEGAEPGVDGEAHYYRLVLPGGRGGIADGKGSYLREDYRFILEALHEE
ncbi:MAG: Ig-like domain-containing protein [Treponema sp.]|nr:Ig-like domain-containing protein [Treponema sp.]